MSSKTLNPETKRYRYESTTVKISRLAHERVRSFAADNGMFIEAVIDRAVTEYLDKVVPADQPAVSV